MRSSIGAIAVVATLLTTTGIARAFDDAKYPDLSGTWERTGGAAPRFDTSKPRGLAQQAPLTPEFQKLYEASLADQAAGGQGDHTVYKCLAWGMPAMMNGYAEIQIVVLPETTYMLIDDGNDSYRRIFTDGRSFPADAEPAFTGYSVGKWLDTTGSGRYDTLEVETRSFNGPRVYDNTGLQLHPDNQSVIRERIYLDKSDHNSLHDEITVEDHALTRPWTVLKTYKRNADAKHIVREDVCVENNPHVAIGGDSYMLSADGYLMPVKKGQKPPDLRYFNQATK
ncbi:MAG TPA: hypothetical protein VGI22_22005 [Xanthobacteraceae bacterium]|jgi:hypothetical protein